MIETLQGTSACTAVSLRLPATAALTPSAFTKPIVTKVTLRCDRITLQLLMQIWSDSMNNRPPRHLRSPSAGFGSPTLHLLRRDQTKASKVPTWDITIQ